MPDVVSKVTQNSMSFSLEQKPRKQSTQYPAAGAVYNAVVKGQVPLINPPSHDSSLFVGN